ADDKVETVKARLVVYHRDTVELIPYYRAQGLLREVGGEGEIEEGYQRLVRVLQREAGAVLPRLFLSNKPELEAPRAIGLVRAAGKIVAEALRLCRQLAKPGTKTVEIDRAVEDLFRSYGAEPLFKGYKGKVPFPAVTCLSVNEQVVHGIPGPRVLKEG